MKWLPVSVQLQAYFSLLVEGCIKDGQRISVLIEIPKKNGEGMVTFISGWMVYPNGHIQLTTPYGGK